MDNVKACQNHSQSHFTTSAGFAHVVKNAKIKSRSHRARDLNDPQLRSNFGRVYWDKLRSWKLWWWKLWWWKLWWWKLWLSKQSLSLLRRVHLRSVRETLYSQKDIDKTWFHVGSFYSCSFAVYWKCGSLCHRTQTWPLLNHKSLPC